MSALLPNLSPSGLHARAEWELRSACVAPAPVATTCTLSKVEAAIIIELADGKQSKEIAACVRLSKASIDTYIRILYGKLGARSRAQLVARAYALGILATSAQT